MTFHLQTWRLWPSSVVNIEFLYLNAAEETLYIYKIFVDTHFVHDDERKISTSDRFVRNMKRNERKKSSFVLFLRIHFFAVSYIRVYQLCLYKRNCAYLRVFVFVTMSEAALVTVISCLIFYNLGFLLLFIVAFKVCYDFFVPHHSICGPTFNAAL